MTLDIPKIPALQSMIARAIANEGGQVNGTNHLCEILPANPKDVRRSLQKANKYQLFRKSSSNPPCGRGHRSIWMLTIRGWHYVKS